MTVDKLSRLYPALGQSAQNTPSSKAEASESESSVPTAPAEAVSVAKTFGVEEDDEGGRKARVEQLKKAVADGSYKPDSTEVAKSVARELFA